MTPSPLEPAEMTLTREQQDEILALGDAAYAASQVPDDGLPADPATVFMPNLADAEEVTVQLSRVPLTAADYAEMGRSYEENPPRREEMIGEPFIAPSAMQDDED